MSDRRLDPDLLIDAIYRALEKWDREARSARNLRVALGTRPGRVVGPTIKRGTKRGAMARYLADAVMTSVREWDAADPEPTEAPQP